MQKVAETIVLAVKLAVAATGLTGCGVRPDDSPAAAGSSYLSLEEWRNIAEPHLRHDPDTLERLKKGNRDLQTQEGWEAFEREELARTEQ